MMKMEKYGSSRVYGILAFSPGKKITPAQRYSYTLRKYHLNFKIELLHGAHDKSKAKGQRTQRKEPVSLSLDQQQARKPEVTATYTYDSST